MGAPSPINDSKRPTTAKTAGGALSRASLLNNAVVSVPKQPAGNQAAVQSQAAGKTQSPLQTPEVKAPSSESRENAPAPATVATSKPSPLQLSRDETEEISIDVKAIAREIQATFPNYTLIFSIISKWSGHDRKLSGDIGSPYLDRLFEVLERCTINIGSWRTAFKELDSKVLDRLIHLTNKVPGRHETLYSYLKDSNAYRDYEPGSDASAIWQWEKMLADEMLEDARRGNYDRVVEKLAQVGITDRDDVSVALVDRMRDRDLLAIAKSNEGQSLLTRLYDELSSGNFGDDERRQADRILLAKSKAFAANDAQVEQDIYQADIKTFPHRQTGITVGWFSAPAAALSAHRSRPGYIWVKLSPGAYTSTAYTKEIKSLGYESYWKGGIELRENELIKVKQYDKGGAEELWPAFKLLEISNEDTTHTFQKIGEVAALALMFGPGAAVEGSIEAATFATRAAQFLRIADHVAAGLGILFSVLLEHRGWFIKTYGDRGKQIVEAIERANSVIAIYGFVRLATQMPRVVGDLRKAAQEWREAVRERNASLELAERQTVRNLDDGVQSLEKGIENVKATGTKLPENSGSLESAPTADVLPPEVSGPDLVKSPKAARSRTEPNTPSMRARPRDTKIKGDRYVPKWDKGELPPPPGAGEQRLKATGTDDIVADVPPPQVQPDNRSPTNVIDFPTRNKEPIPPRANDGLPPIAEPLQASRSVKPTASKTGKSNVIVEPRPPLRDTKQSTPKTPPSKSGSVSSKPKSKRSASKPVVTEAPRTPADELDDFKKMLADDFGGKGPIVSDELLQLYRHGSRATMVKYLKAYLKKQTQKNGVITFGEWSLKVDPKISLDKQLTDFIEKLEGAHSTPQAFGKKLPKEVLDKLPNGEYNPDDALVILTDKSRHTFMDQPWKDAFNKLRKEGTKGVATEATGQWVFNEVADGIRKTPGMNEGEKASRVARLHDEMFIELGMSPVGKYTIPQILKLSEILAIKAKKAAKK